MNFLRSQRVDRCVTCHIAAEKRGFEDKQKYPQSVLRTHPRLDLFVDSNSPHPYATFGCTSCHGGRDRATDFMRAGHMPNDYAAYEKLEEELHTGRDEKGMPVDDDALREEMGETQTGRWMKEYDWEVDKFNDLPMYPMKAVEAGCFRCHRQDAGHPKAAKLDQGRKLIEALGCWSCHRMKGLEDLREARTEPRARRGQDDAGMDGPLAREPARLPQQHEDAAASSTSRTSTRRRATS